MRPSDPTRDKRDLIACVVVFLTCLTIFWFSPVHQVTDSNYSMLLSQGLLEHRSFALDRFKIPRLEPVYHDHTWKNGSIRQLELVGPHFYYYMPPGSSVLSVPYVAAANLFGFSPKNPDGTYNPQGELQIETSLAAILMAGAALLFYLTARLLLPVSWSLVVAFGAALGTQIWSTSSRALWADTWGILLLSIVVYLLLADELGKRRLVPEILATILAWMYFVRPTYSVMILAITVYMLQAKRGLFLRYTVTGVVWLVAFICYSWIHYHAVLPTYFRINERAGFAYFWEALPGNLISPSRGLLVYVPVLLVVGYLMVRYRKSIEPRRLMVLALAVMFAFLVVISGFDPWWAGASYGPRYMAPLIPWFVLLAVLAIRAMRASRPYVFLKPASLIAALLLVLSVSINAIGAFSKEAWVTWNAHGDIDHDPRKVWDIRYPQLLAPFMRPPLPDEFPQVAERIDLASAEAQKFLPYGWSGPETGFRWTDGSEAAVIFSLSQVSDGRMRIRLTPFLVKGRHDSQRVEILVNNHSLQTLDLRSDAAVHEITLPGTALSQKNVLVIRLPDAASPSDFKINADERRLGIAVNWIEFSFPAQP